jgi:hypothetical protein
MPVDLDASNRDFVDAVMLPLDSDPLHRESLEETLAIAATVLPPSGRNEPSDAAGKMISSSRGFRSRVFAGSILFSLVLALVAWSSVCGPPALRSLDEVLLANRMSNAIGSMCCSHQGVPRLPWVDRKPGPNGELASVNRVLESMPPEDRLRCTGDYSKKDRMERWKAVHDRYPQDPAHYYAYALTYRSTNSSWPEDLVKRGEELDPDNGWFRLLAGVEMAKSSLGVRPAPRITKEQRLAARAEGRTVLRPAPNENKRVEILDPALLGRAYNMIDQALQMPRLDDYSRTLNRIRFEASPEPTSFALHSFAHVLAFTQPEDHSSAWLPLRDLAKALSLSAESAGRKRDAAALGLIQHRVQLIGSRLTTEGSSLVSQLVIRVLMRIPIEALAEAWAAMDDPSEAGRLIAIAGTIHHKSPPSGSKPPDALSEHRGSSFVAQMEGFSRHESSAPVTEPRLRGGRLAEYAMYERFMAHAVAFAFCMVLASLLIRSAFEKKRLGLLPERFAGLLTFSDRIRILLLGVVLPFTLYLVSTRARWIDPREFALSETRFFLWLAQSLGLVLAVILITLDTAGRCLNRRSPMLALRWRPLDYTWTFGWTALLFIPVASVMARFDPRGELREFMFWSSVAFMVGTPFLYLCSLAVFTLAGSPSRKLHRAILLRTLAMPLALASLLVAVSIPRLRAEERFWVARIDFEALHPDYNIFSPKPEIEYAAGMAGEVRRAAAEMAK